MRAVYNYELRALTTFSAVMSARVAAASTFRSQVRVIPGPTWAGQTWASPELLMLYVLNSWILFGKSHWQYLKSHAVRLERIQNKTREMSSRRAERPTSSDK